MNFFRITALLVFTITACNKATVTVSNNTNSYKTVEAKIYNYNNPIQLIGANTFHIFSAGGSYMGSWNINITREFIGNVKEVLLTKAVFKDANAAYIYPLQALVDSNHISKRITIICPFRWNGDDTTDCTGKRPTQTFWWTDLK